VTETSDAHVWSELELDLASYTFRELEAHHPVHRYHMLDSRNPQTQDNSFEFSVNYAAYTTLSST
jgi:hypothetical protein